VCRDTWKREHLEDLGINGGKLILGWILGKKGWKVWTGLIWLRIGAVKDSCEHSNEPSGPIKDREFLV
jgi:hypothetical protein